MRRWGKGMCIPGFSSRIEARPHGARGAGAAEQHTPHPVSGRVAGPGAAPGEWKLQPKAGQLQHAQGPRALHEGDENHHTYMILRTLSAL